MIQIRHGVFETNSSSTHSICIATKSDYDAWRNGELLYDSWNKKLITQEESKVLHLNDRFFDADEDLQTFEEYNDDWDLEHYTEHYTSESGDEIVIFGEYGYDG